MDTHPVNREEILLFQLLVTGHLLTEVADFDIECAVTQYFGQRLEHQAEEQVARILFVMIVYALTQHAAVNEQGEEERSETDDAEQVAHHFVFLVGDNHHIGFLTRCLPHHLKESPAVEEIIIFQSGQVFVLPIDNGLKSIHIAKINKKRHRTLRLTQINIYFVKN